MSGSKRAASIAVVLFLSFAPLMIFTPFVHAATATSPTQSASLVIGQGNFTTDFPATTKSGFFGPQGIAFDSSGNLWVADSINCRVLEFAAPFTDGEGASVVIGQANFTGGYPATTQSGLNAPEGIAFDSKGNLWVADQNNARVLEFAPPFSNGEAASLVIGQSNFTSSLQTTTQSGLTSPYGVAFDSAGNLWVSDSSNNRVLEYSAPFTTGESASMVIGQSDFTSSLQATTQGGLSSPYGIGFDSTGNLWVADQGNNRVLEYASPLATGETASVVIGQPGFTTNSSATSQSGLRHPTGVAFDASGNLWVPDAFNNRVLEYTMPFTNGEPAALVIGQAGFTTYGSATTQSGLSTPAGIAFDSSGNQWISETFNNRVVEYAAQLPQLITAMTSTVTSTVTATTTSSMTSTLTTTATQTVPVTTTATTTVTSVTSSGAGLVSAVSLPLAAVIVAIGLVAFALLRRRGPKPTPA